MPEKHSPAAADVSERIVLFDGVCCLCSAWAKFLIRVDRKRRFRLGTVQSPQGRAILERYGLSTDDYDTMVLVDEGELFTKSLAFLRVMRLLPLPWPVFCVGYLIPNKIRDWCYDRIARNRYRLFGRYEQCMLPDPKHLNRFLGN